MEETTPTVYVVEVLRPDEERYEFHSVYATLAGAEDRVERLMKMSSPVNANRPYYVDVMITPSALH
jgi:hypothetical protein